jgi:hypothetical protein
MNTTNLILFARSCAHSQAVRKRTLPENHVCRAIRHDIHVPVLPGQLHETFSHTSMQISFTSMLRP